MKATTIPIICCLMTFLVVGGPFAQNPVAAENDKRAEHLFVRRITPLFH